MFKEFREFIQRGNVLELAVGFIMGTYFGAIVKSLVDDILMPPLSFVMSGVEFSEWKLVLKEARPAIMDKGIVVEPAVTEVALKYGNFISVLLTFGIVALAAFLLIRAYNRYLNKQDKDPAPNPPQPTKEVELLTEIRDALRK